METKYTKQIMKFLNQKQFLVNKNSPQIYGVSGQPDIFASRIINNKTINLCIEVKDFDQPSKLKKQQVYMLNQYKNNGWFVFVIDDQEKYLQFQKMINKIIPDLTPQVSLDF